MGLDIAVGARQDQLNAVAAVLYRQLYPNLFTGSVQVPTLGLTVAYDVQQAPVFNLAPPAAEQRSVLEDHARQALAGVEQGAGPRAGAVLAGLMDSTVLFSITAAKVAVTLTAANDNKTELTIAATAVCQADIDASTGQVGLTALHVSVPTWSDPTVQWVLENVISPEVQKVLNQYLAGVTLPPLVIAGVPLHTPIVVIQNATLVAVTTLQSSGPPTPPPAGTAWPSGEFFTLLSSAAADAAAAYQIAQLNPRFQDSGSASWTIFTVDWDYNLTLGHPGIGLSGNDFHLGLQLSGGVGAGLSADLKIWHPSIHFGVGFSTDPDPGGTVRLGVSGGNVVVLSIQKVDAFGIAVRIPGLPSWANEAIGWVTSVLTQALTGTLVPAVNAFIGSLSFPIFTIPSIPVNAGPVHVRVVPSGLRVGNFNGFICAAGALQVQPA